MQRKLACCVPVHLGLSSSLKECTRLYLYHEWLGKPAIIITYGTRGGGKAAAQLQQVSMETLQLPTLYVPLHISVSFFLGQCLQVLY